MARLGGGLEVLAARGDSHGLLLALLNAERAVHPGPADERRVLEVGSVVGAAGLEGKKGGGARATGVCKPDGTCLRWVIYSILLSRVVVYNRTQQETEPSQESGFKNKT